MEQPWVTNRRDALTLIACCLTILSLAKCQNACPARCLCYFGQQPRTVICSRQGLETFPANISDIVEHLDLSSNLLTEITDDINHLADLRFLNLSRNRLSYLPNYLENLKNLRRLDLTDNNIYDVADITSVDLLPSLAVLYLSGNPLADLKGLTSSVIQALDASHCAVKEITNVSLIGLPALTTLSLVGNPLKIIRAPFSQKLRWLDMSDCLLNYLGPDTFRGFPGLEELRMANNPTLVYSTRRSTLRHLNLRRLDVSRCNLDRPGLHGLPLLTHARLSRNSIRLLPDRIFVKNRQLTHLFLNSNGLEHLNTSTFEGLVKLQVLDLSANGIERFHKLTFHENVELRSLNLSYNSMLQFPNITSAVMSLDLSSNLISTLKKDSFLNMPRIKSVNLSDNRLQFIPSVLKSPTLSVLNLSRNRLVQVKNNSFVELPHLQKIDLSGNRLTEAMDPEVFRNNPDLTTVKLEDNPWRCDCMQLYVTFEFLTDVPPKTAAASLICQSPANISGYSWESACFDIWSGSVYYNKDNTWGMVLISLLTLIVLAGSVVSIRHTMKMKRRALEQRQQLEVAEARERLRLLQRRNQRTEEDAERPPEPRINPLELMGPPSYEEAVQMLRLTHSLDALNEVSRENVSMRVLGSVDNLRAKKRRARRPPRKRTQSEDDLLRREERRQERIRRERNNSTGNICDVDQTRTAGQRNSRYSTARRNRRLSAVDDTADSGSSRGRPRPQTPSARKRKRRQMARDEHSSDDEDSDIQRVNPNEFMIIRELRREPRSGHRESTTERES